MSAFLNLPSDLALEIIRFAASSQPTLTEQNSRSYYSTALLLSRVCYAVRLATVPFLLHTVILRSTADIVLFSEAVSLQEKHRINQSRLAVDYHGLIKRLWCTECREPIVNDLPTDVIDCRLLWEITRGVETLGLQFSSAYFLSSNLIEFSDAFIPPNRRVVLTGSNKRWNPFTYTAEGLTFFKQISHLLIWDTEEQNPSNTNKRIPKWVMDVPFKHLPNLTHFAFPMLQEDVDMDGYKTIEMAACTVPRGCHGGATVRDWLTENQLNMFAYISFQTPQACALNVEWETSFLEGKDEYVWRKAEKLTRKLWSNNDDCACY